MAKHNDPRKAPPELFGDHNMAKEDGDGGLGLEIQTRFTHHTPTESQIEWMGTLREEARALALKICSKLPACRERVLALTKLEEAVMHADSGLMRRGERT